MPIDVFRTKFISNQIAAMHITQQFTADGHTQNFTLAYEVYSPNWQTPNDSAEIEVFDNGLKLERFGGSLEYGITTSSGGLLNVISFVTAPVDGHIITAEYRQVVPKT